jgi:transcriptional regulator
MYVPSMFTIKDRAEIHDVMRRHSFALLVSERDGEPFATHVPLLLDVDAGPHGTLLGHVAKANPHAELLAGRRVLAVFSGPHAYISPTWYETPNMVPTWNYVAVHAYGTCEVITDEAEVLRILSDTASVYEAGMPEPWSFPPGDEFIRKLASGIVAFRIPIDRLEGKAKLNQNHPPERRERVAAKLAASADPDSQAIARLMRGDGP